MPFLVISQRAIANNSYSLKNLTGHGRIDIVFRCILASCRTLLGDKGQEIYCYLKGSSPNGWLHLTPEDIKENDDEISVAGFVKDNWDNMFTEGPLKDLILRLPSPFILLTEKGYEFQPIKGTIVLGAQQDLSEQDLIVITIDHNFSLGRRSLLASHAIIYTRQLFESF